MQRKTVVLLPPKKRVRDWSQEKKPKQAILLRLRIQVREQHGVWGEGRGERGAREAVQIASLSSPAIPRARACERQAQGDTLS